LSSIPVIAEQSFRDSGLSIPVLLDISSSAAGPCRPDHSSSAQDQVLREE